MWGEAVDSVAGTLVGASCSVHLEGHGRTVGKSDVALQLLLHACFVSQVGACWGWEYMQEEKTPFFPPGKKGS